MEIQPFEPFKMNTNEDDFDLPTYTIEGENRPKKKLDIYFEEVVSERAILEKTSLDFTATQAERSRVLDFFKKRAQQLYSEEKEQEAYIEQKYGEILARAVERFKTETTIQDEIEGIADVGNIADIKNMIEAHDIKKTYFAPEHGAVYSPLRDKIMISHKLQVPNNASIISDLLAGDIPYLFNTIIHEMIHAEQYADKKYLAKSNFISLSGLIILIQVAMINSQDFHGEEDAFIYLILSLLAASQYMKKKEKDLEPLQEVQAFSPEFNWAFYRSPRKSMIQHLQSSSYRMTTTKQVDQILSASIDIDCLLALGFSHKQIARLCQGTTWNHETHRYNRLHDAIESIKLERGLSDEELGSLMDARMLKRKINRLKIQKITLEETAKEMTSNAKMDKPNNTN